MYKKENKLAHWKDRNHISRMGDRPPAPIEPEYLPSNEKFELVESPDRYSPVYSIFWEDQHYLRWMDLMDKENPSNVICHIYGSSWELYVAHPTKLYSDPDSLAEIEAFLLQNYGDTNVVLLWKYHGYHDTVPIENQEEGNNWEYIS